MPSIGRNILLYFIFLFGLILLPVIEGSDRVQSYLNPQKLYQKKLSLAKEMKISYEMDLIQCQKELRFLVRNKKINIQRHIIDGIPANRAVELWKDEVIYTRDFCTMYKDGIKESKDDIVLYKDKLNDPVE